MCTNFKFYFLISTVALYVYFSLTQQAVHLLSYPHLLYQPRSLFPNNIVVQLYSHNKPRPAPRPRPRSYTFQTQLIHSTYIPFMVLPNFDTILSNRILSLLHHNSLVSLDHSTVVPHNNQSRSQYSSTSPQSV